MVFLQRLGAALCFWPGLVAILFALSANAQIIGVDECPPQSGDIYYLGMLGSPNAMMSSWLATEHAVNSNALAAKPSIGCFDFKLSFFPGGEPSEELTCMKDEDYRFPTDITGASVQFRLDLNDCEDFCIPKNIMRYDTGCTASRGEPGANAVLAQAAEAGVDLIGIVGASCSGPTTMSAPIFEAAGLPQIAPSATSGLLSDVEKYPNFFRTAAGDDGQSKALLDLISYYGIKKAAVIGTRDAFAGVFADSINKFAPSSGVEIVALEKVCEDTNCLDSYEEIYGAMQRIKDTGVKVVFSTSHCDNARLIREIAYKLDMTAENCYMFVSGDASASDTCYDLLETESHGGFHTEFVPKEANLGFLGTMPRGGSGDIYKDFTGYWASQDKCKFPGQIHREGVTDVCQFCAEAYDAVLAYAMAIKNIRTAGGEVTPAAVLAELDKDDFTFQGATGIVSFGGEFDPPIGDHDRPPVYDIVSYEGRWLTVGYWSPLDIFPVNIFFPVIFPTAKFSPPECLLGN